MDTITEKRPPEALALPRIGEKEAKNRHLLSGGDLEKLHLSPTGAPVACTMLPEGGVIYYYDPNRVEPAAPPQKPRLSPENPVKLKLQNAIKEGYFPRETLLQMYYEPTEGPVAFCIRHGEEVPLFDKTTCRRLPLPCAKCGNPVRYRAKLCRSCYEAQMAEKRAEGDRYRGAAYGMARERVLFFDLEMTGLYEHDEVLSVTVADGNGNTVFDTLVRPVRKKKWKRTEEIHGITPEDVKNAPTMSEIAPVLCAVLNGADRLVAFGTATDYFHLSRLYPTRREREALHAKIVDCGAEFSRYVYEHEIELSHQSLGDAMAVLGLTWHGNAHTSAADTDACRMVFETLFPHYFE